MGTNKVLFLDFDGVLNSRQHLLMIKHEPEPTADDPETADFLIMVDMLNKNNVWCLKYIMEKVPDLKIVLSTAWRTQFSMENFVKLFNHYGLDGSRIIGMTPKKMSSVRCEEVRMWMADNAFSGTWALVDDHVVFDLQDSHRSHELNTNAWTGMTLEDAFELIHRFDPTFEAPVVVM